MDNKKLIIIVLLLALVGLTGAAIQDLVGITCQNCTLDNPTFTNFTFPGGNNTTIYYNSSIDKNLSNYSNYYVWVNNSTIQINESQVNNLTLDLNKLYLNDSYLIRNPSKDSLKLYSSTFPSNDTLKFNTGVGELSLVTTGERGSAFGYGAGYLNTGPLGLSALGFEAGDGNSANYLSAFGYLSGFQNTGLQGSFFGDYSGYQNSGSTTNAIGSHSGYTNIGSGLTAYGGYSGYHNQGTNLLSFGYYSGYNNTGNAVVALGYYAGYNNSGKNGVFLGSYAGRNNTLDGQLIIQNNGSETSTYIKPLVLGNFSTGQVYLPGINISGQNAALCYNSSNQGEITNNAGLTTCLVSSIKYKTNVSYISNYANNTLMGLKAAKYEEKNTSMMLNGTYYPNKKRVGFIAEDIYNSTPAYRDYLIGYEYYNQSNISNGINMSNPRGLNYEGLLTLAIKTIQEQQTVIDRICTKNATLCT